MKGVSNLITVKPKVIAYDLKKFPKTQSSPSGGCVSEHQIAMADTTTGKPPGSTAIGWRCCACGEPITRIEAGWVEWLAGEDEHGNAEARGLRLVHALAASPRGSEGHGCQYDARQEFRRDQSVVEGLLLERFVGPDGLMMLLSLIAADELPRDELVELAKRLQIPGYEQARELIPQAIADGVMAPSIGSGYYLQSEIQSVLRWRECAREPG